MQTISTELDTAIKRAYSLTVRPKVVMEWDYNRFAQEITVTNSDTDYFRPSEFGIRSIVGKNRPRSGAPKAVFGQIWLASEDSDFRYRLVGKDEDKTYEYWLSPQRSKASGGYSIDGCRPEVVYDKLYDVNTIVVCFEISWGISKSGTPVKPDAFTVQTTTNGTTWTTVATNPTIGSDGRVKLYRQANGSWSDVAVDDNPTPLMGVRINVTSMNRPGVRCGVIELGLRYRQNLTDEVVSVSVNKQAEQMEVGSPMGTPAASTCTVTFNNTAERFNPSNGASDLHGLLDQNARMHVYYGADSSEFGGTGIEYVKQGTFYVDSWEPDDDNATVNATATDFSKFLQEKTIIPCLFQSQRVSTTIRDILESIGVTKIKLNITADEFRPDFIFYNDQTSVWEALAQIARSDQGWFTFDEDEYFVYTSKDAYLGKNGVDLRIDANMDGDNLPNLINLNPQYEVEANSVKVTYTDLHPKARGGKQLNGILWQPDDNLTLQASVLKKEMTDTQDYFVIDSKDARYWPLQGAVNIEGEIIEYDGIRVQKGSDFKTRKRRGQHPGYHPTGRFVNCKRGQRGSNAKAHEIGYDKGEGWQLFETKGGAATDVTSAKKMIGFDADGHMALKLPAKTKYDTFGSALRGTGNTRYMYFGTRLMFEHNDGRNMHVGGLCYNVDSNGIAGYYVQIATSQQVKKWKNSPAEIKIFRRYANGDIKGLPNNDGFDKDEPDKAAGRRGFDYPGIAAGVHYDLEVYVDRNLQEHHVYFNGMKVAEFKDPYGDWRPEGRWGVFVRGGTKQKYEYVYAANLNDLRRIEDDLFYDRKEGSYQSGFAMKRHVEGGSNDFQFHEFRPIVHEVRDFKIKFADDVSPALSAQLYLHTDWRVHLMKFRHSPYGAYFTIANAYRDMVVLKGTDYSITPGEATEQDMFVYGVPVVRDSERRLTYTDDDKIRRRGPVELEIVNPWIQERGQADNLGDYIKTHWGTPVDVITVSIWGHLGLQLGDVVSIEYPFRNMTHADYKYHVTAISMDFDEGLDTTLTLRRKRV